MHENYPAKQGIYWRGIFLNASRIVQKCIWVFSMILLIMFAYFAYVRTVYNRDAQSIARVAAGNSSVEKWSSRHVVASALQPEKIRDYVAQPITDADVENLHQFSAEYQKVHEALVRGFDRITWGDEENGVSTARIYLMVANMIFSTFYSYGESPNLDKAVIEHGGYEKYYNSVFSFAGVLAAIDVVALSYDLRNKHSDAMIERVLAEEALVKSRYEDGIVETEDGDVDAKAVIMASGAGIVALAKVPRASFEAWRALSVQERRRVAEEMEVFREGDLFLGVAFDPVKIFEKVLVDEWKRQN